MSAYSTVHYDTNNYSIPVRLCGKIVSIKALPERIEIFSEGETVAVHQRCFGRYQSIYCLEHYLPLLERKGRALFHARPVRDNVPDSFLSWLKRQNLKPKALVALLKQSLAFGYEAVMNGYISPEPAPTITDVVGVSDVDLTAYDALCGAGKEVSI